MWIEAHRNRVREQTLVLDKLPSSFDGLQFYFISDVHRRCISRHMLKQIKGRCEFIIIGGDLLERRVPLSRVEDNLHKLASIAPTYFIWGNNDQEIDLIQLRACLKRQGIQELNNEWTVIERDLQEIALVGVDTKKKGKDDIELFEKAKTYPCSILLSHYPEVINHLPSVHSFSLCLSGHTHGGQIRLFGWGIAEKGGIKATNGLLQVISNGYGTTGLPLRLGAPAETHLFTLKKRKS
jgi:predicted MPP superfamily phosphohydrolase